MHVHFLRVLHKEDSLVGVNGWPASKTNPPSYLIGDLDEIRLVSLLPCCEEMAKRIQDKTIEFGSRWEEVYHNKLADVFIRVEGGARVLPAGENPPKPNTDIALAYCPWCTKPIETHEVATV